MVCKGVADVGHARTRTDGGFSRYVSGLVLQGCSLFSGDRSDLGCGFRLTQDDLRRSSAVVVVDLDLHAPCRLATDQLEVAGGRVDVAELIELDGNALTSSTAGTRKL